MACSSLCHAQAKIFRQQNSPIKALKIISDLNHKFEPVLVLIRSWDVTISLAVGRLHWGTSVAHTATKYV